MEQGAFSESGAGGLGMSFFKRDNDSIRGTLGVRVSHVLESVVPSTARFVGVPATFKVRGAKTDRERALISAGLSWEF